MTMETQSMKRWTLFAALVAVLAPASLWAAEIPTTSPEQVGLSAQTLAEIGPAMQSFIDDGKLVGISTIVARRGSIAHFQQFGLADREAEKPMRADTIFRIYSMTKPITTTALMMLYEQGRFQLDDPVEKYIPEFSELKVASDPRDADAPLVAPKRPMTIRDLMRHTSGLTYGFAGNSTVEAAYNEQDVLSRDGDLHDMIEKLAGIPLLFHPGDRWNYSVSVDVQGYLVEVLAGMPFDEYLREKIFEPLDMRDTGFHVPTEKLSRFSANYGPGGDDLRLIDDPADSSYGAPTTFFSGGGGLVSTARDYLRFCQCILQRGEFDGTRILKAETVDLMTQNHLPDDLVPIGIGPLKIAGCGFGLGFAVRVEPGPGDPPAAQGEYWWGGAASTNFWLVPREQMVGIALTQHIPLANQYNTKFRSIVYRAIEESYDPDAAAGTTVGAAATANP